MSAVPAIRIRPRNAAPLREQGRFVLYWMTSARRVRWNFGLQHAASLARELSRPLLILEALGCRHRWACDRTHRFVLQGMQDNAQRVAASGRATYHPYLERTAGEGRGLVETLAAQACAVVTDDYPAFFLPRMIDAVAARLPVRLEQVDSNGLLPMRAAPEAFTTAQAFRRFVHRQVSRLVMPDPEPLSSALARPAPVPDEVVQRWPACDLIALDRDPHALDPLPIDHEVTPVEDRGGAEEAEARLDAFVRRGLHRYAEYHNAPDEDATSRLSGHLHFGHVAPQQVFAAVADAEGWNAEKTGGAPAGKREGWWGMSPDAEAFLDQLITWRELGFNMCCLRPDFDQYDSLPGWARQTLAEHAADRRKHLYSRSELESAATHDPIWNAAQTQLCREGRIHNYLRMLWGKKILEWSPGPRDALQTMIELNDRWALDGRDPNSYSGIFWVLGRYDRAWGPERPVFGKIRYMSSDNTARKLPIEEYMHRYGKDWGLGIED